jgi:hypothetical protein
MCVEMSDQFVGFPLSSFGTRCRKRASPPAGPVHSSGWTASDASGGMTAHTPVTASFKNRGSAAEGGGEGSRTSRHASVSRGGEPCQYKSCCVIRSTAPVSPENYTTADGTSTSECALFYPPRSRIESRRRSRWVRWPRERSCGEARKSQRHPPSDYEFAPRSWRWAWSSSGWRRLHWPVRRSAHRANCCRHRPQTRLRSEDDSDLVAWPNVTREWVECGLHTGVWDLEGICRVLEE